MDLKHMNKTQKIAFSGIVMAIYIVVMYLTQSFAFGQYQIRIATALYSLSSLFGFLVIPLGLSNLLTTMVMGGLGFFDIVGGGVVGLLTAGCCALIRRLRLNEWFLVIPITLIPGLGVSLWLSKILGVPYWAMAASLLVGQFVSGVVGVLLAKALGAALKLNGKKEASNERAEG